MTFRVHTVSYAVAGYSGTVEVITNPGSEEDEEVVLAKARKLLHQKAGAPLPFGAYSMEVLGWTDREH